jgi:ArsR family transcriptional regulator
MSIELPVLPDLRMELAPPDVDAPLEVATLLADRARAGILALLGSGPHCVCEMAAALGERQNNVSNHLARLREAGLVRASRHGADSRRIYYERDETACAAALAELRTLLEPIR